MKKNNKYETDRIKAKDILILNRWGERSIDPLDFTVLNTFLESKDFFEPIETRIDSKGFHYPVSERAIPEILFAKKTRKRIPVVYKDLDSITTLAYSVYPRVGGKEVYSKAMKALLALDILNALEQAHPSIPKSKFKVQMTNLGWPDVLFSQASLIKDFSPNSLKALRKSPTNQILNRLRNLEKISKAKKMNILHTNRILKKAERKRNLTSFQLSKARKLVKNSSIELKTAIKTASQFRKCYLELTSKERKWVEGIQGVFNLTRPELLREMVLFTKAHEALFLKWKARRK